MQFQMSKMPGVRNYYKFTVKILLFTINNINHMINPSISLIFLVCHKVYSNKSGGYLRLVGRPFICYQVAIPALGLRAPGNTCVGVVKVIIPS